MDFKDHLKNPSSLSSRSLRALAARNRSPALTPWRLISAQLFILCAVSAAIVYLSVPHHPDHTISSSPAKPISAYSQMDQGNYLLGRGQTEAAAAAYASALSSSTMNKNSVMQAVGGLRLTAQTISNNVPNDPNLPRILDQICQFAEPENPNWLFAKTLMAESSIRAGNYKQAAASLTEAINRHRASVLSKGHEWDWHREYPAALLDLERADKALAMAADATHTRDELALYLRRSVIDPSSAKDFCQRAQMWDTIGRLDEAESDCNLAIKANPFFADGYISRARVYALKHKPDLYSKDMQLAEKLRHTTAGGTAQDKK